MVVMEIWIERRDVNVELLDSQIRAAAGSSFYGLSTRRGGITLFVAVDITTQLREQIVALAQTHDATQLTPQQQAAVLRQTNLAQGRSEPPLRVSDYARPGGDLEALAKKIAWLEQELRDLRGL